MKNNSPRANRVAVEVKRVVSEYLINGVLDDFGDIKSSMIVVTDVVMSSDLSHAKIFVSPISILIDNDNCIKFLESHLSKIRYYLGKNIRLKVVPELRFFIDNSFEYAKKMDKIFDSLHNKNTN